MDHHRIVLASRAWRRIPVRFAALGLLAALAGCAEPPASGDEVSTVMFSLTQIPTDVHCLRITATGSRVVTRSFDLPPGSNSELMMSGLPVGSVAFLGEAFSQRCNQVTTSSLVLWISDPVSATLHAGVVEHVTMVMRRNGRATVGVDFQDEPMCRAAGQPCAMNAECCTGLSCIAGPDGQTSCGVETLPRLLLYAVLVVDLGGVSPNPSALEIVDLDTRMRVRTLDLGSRTVSAVAISPNGTRAYLADSNRALVSVIDTTSGATVMDIAVTFPRDIVISPDGARVYATSGNSFVAIDTTTNTVVSTLSTGSDTPLGLTLSSDGTMLGAPSTVGGSNTGYYLVNATVPLTLLSRVPVGNPRAGCTSFPNDTTFTNTGRALMWDSSCDA
ncbi:MAG TPA: hypothetical protein VNN80_13205, partial [Polyangiaceae bacterium]|nr:hypothetical protein [Polyangiaceae bacterium]